MPARRPDLAGRTILVTRAAADAEAWAERLRARGARAVVLPCIHSETLPDGGTAAALRTALDGAGWLALTSARGVYAVAELVGLPAVAAVAVAAVGEATAAAARAALGRVDLVAPGGTGASLAAELARRIRAARHNGPSLQPAQAARSLQAEPSAPRVVAAGAEGARRDLEEALAPFGITVQRFAVYRVVPASPREPREELAARGIDTILLASPSAVTGLLARAVVPAGARIITIGTTTSAAVRAAGLPVHGEAAGRSLEAMIEAIP
jgi:uroporphyrinogen-III synthase